MLLNNKALGTDSSLVDSTSSALDAAEQEQRKKELKNSDKLIKSILDLTKSLNKIESDFKKGGNPNGRATLGGMMKNAKETVGKFTSLSGLAGMAQDRTSGITSAIFGQVAEQLDQRKEKKQKEKNFITAVGSGTQYGRELIKQDPKNAIKTLKEKYKEKSALELNIAAREEKRAAMKSFGKEAGVETDILPEELKQMEGWKEELEKLNKLLSGVIDKEEKDKPLDKPEVSGDKSGDKSDDKRPEAPATSEMSDEEFEAKKKELILGVSEGIQEAYNELSTEEKAIVDAQGKDFGRGIAESVLEELNSISKEQLAELIKLNDRLDVKTQQAEKGASAVANASDAIAAKEAEIESRTKSASGITGAPPKEKKEDRSMFGKLIDGAMSLFKGPLGQMMEILKDIPGTLMKVLGPVVGAIGPLLSGLAPLLGPAAALAGAGAVGAAIGTGINKGWEAITGNTPGASAYNAGDTIKGWLGFKTDKQKQEEAEDAAKLELGQKQLAEGKKVNKDMAAFLEKKGIKVEADRIQEPPKPGEKPETAANIEKSQDTTSSTKIEKQSEVRESATDYITEQMDKTEAKESRTVVQQQAPTIVNAPTTNNSHTTNITRPPLRNADPTFMKIENRRLAF